MILIEKIKIKFLLKKIDRLMLNREYALAKIELTYTKSLLEEYKGKDKLELIEKFIDDSTKISDDNSFNTYITQNP